MNLWVMTHDHAVVTPSGLSYYQFPNKSIANSKSKTDSHFLNATVYDEARF